MNAGPSAAPGLYIHIPFCSAICPYCDFAVTTGGRDRRRRFVAELLLEIADPRHGAWRFDTVYFGGGTPSALDPASIEAILAAIHARFEIAPGARISLEANPEDIDDGAARRLRALGIGTLSLGVQSFDASALRLLGRRHSPGDARRAVGAALDAGFDTVSVDLIFGLPGQTTAALDREIETLAELGPDHVSGYQLTIHDGTPFAARVARGALEELATGRQAELFARLHGELAGRGFAAYEVSNFARAPQHRSAHNQKYWRHVDYLGLGPSAHSLRGARRWWNVRDAGAYSERIARGESAIDGDEELDTKQRALEALMLGLRTTDGIDRGEFLARFGSDLETINARELASLRARGYVAEDSARLRLTVRGLAVADAIAARLETGV